MKRIYNYHKYVLKATTAHYRLIIKVNLKNRETLQIDLKVADSQNI
jgi:hypothetical protein